MAQEFYLPIKRFKMENLIKTVCEKAGISEEQAKSAVETVVNFIKDKLPAGFGDQVDNFLKSGPAGDIADNLKDKVGGFFKK